MNLKDVLEDSQYDVCLQEQNYYRRIGIEKTLLEIATNHKFLPAEEKAHTYSLELIKEFDIIIVKEDDEFLYVETKVLLGPKRLALLEKKLHKNVKQRTIPVREFKEKLQSTLIVDPDTIDKKIKKFNAFDADDDAILELFRMILLHGVKNEVSDIHINAYEDFYWLRYREDGKVKSKYLLNIDLAQRFSLIIKEKSNLDLINVKTPQSGGFTDEFSGTVIDFRVEIAPSYFGENIVIRLLDKSNNLKSLPDLFPGNHPMSQHVFRYVNQKNGFFLTVGPTGSGKTTTLNAIVTQRDRLNEVIYTLEDPIEYKIDFVTQYQINEEVDFSFSTAMKSVMRQDPDVIVIGEMRDKESIKIALKAAHSGHMVFSTLHTTNSYMALERIRDEGGDLFILAYSLSGVIAQRLVPKLCSCKNKTMKQDGKKYFESDFLGYEKNGCAKCNFTGYKGRVLLTDMVFIPSDMKTRYSFYMALKNSTVLKAWDDLITFSYYQSAQFLFNEGLCDYDTLILELLSLGYIDEA